MATDPTANDSALPGDVLPASPATAETLGAKLNPDNGAMVTSTSATDPEPEVGTGTVPP